MELESFTTLMEKINKNTLGCYPITFDEGKILNILLETFIQNRNLINVVEVGTCVGYSTIWIYKGIKDLKEKAKIYTFEKNSRRIKEAKKNFNEVSKINPYENINKYIKIINGNAIEDLPKIKVTIDFIFLDGIKEEYLEYLKLLNPHLTKGSIISAHNVISHKSLMEDFLDEINNSDNWKSAIIPTKSGISISIKK